MSCSVALVPAAVVSAMWQFFLARISCNLLLRPQVWFDLPPQLEQRCRLQGRAAMAPGVVGEAVAAVGQLQRSMCLLQGSRLLVPPPLRRLHRRILVWEWEAVAP